MLDSLLGALWCGRGVADALRTAAANSTIDVSGDLTERAKHQSLDTAKGAQASGHWSLLALWCCKQSVVQLPRLAVVVSGDSGRPPFHSMAWRGTTGVRGRSFM